MKTLIKLKTTKLRDKKENEISKNIPLDYLYNFTRNFELTGAIWVLYMIYRGLPLWQVGIAEGAYHITSLIFEVPSGAWADIYGRKRLMILGRACSAISSIICLFSTNLLGFCIAFVFTALGNNMNSGSEEALVFDSLKQAGNESQYLKVNSRLNVIIEVSQGLATFLGGALAEISFEFCYLASLIIVGLSIIPCFMLQEPNIHQKESKERISLKEHYLQSFRVIKENRAVLNILIYYPIVFSFHTVIYFYGQQYFSLYGLSKVEISLIMLLAGAGGIAGALSCEMILSHMKNYTKYVASILLGLSIVLISINHVVISIIAFMIMNYTNSLLYPIQSNSLNQIIPSNQRATIISVGSMMFSVAMIALFPLTGLLADVIGLNITFLGLGIMLILFTGLLVRKR